MSRVHRFTKRGVICGAGTRDTGRRIATKASDITCRRCLVIFATVVGFMATNRWSVTP